MAYFTVAGPSELAIISGVGYDEPKLMINGSAFICCCLHRVQKISLDLMTIVIDSQTVYTAQGVPISVTGVAQVRHLCGVTCEHFFQMSKLSQLRIHII